MDNVHNALIVTNDKVIAGVQPASCYECRMTASGCQLSDCCYHPHPPS